jgi:preprotein translocase, YajC subunit
MPGGLMQILTLVIICVAFYGFLLLPERKRRKGYNEMLDSLKVGDKVMTRGGIIGNITQLDEETLILDIEPDGIRITIAKQGISTRINQEAEM